MSKKRFLSGPMIFFVIFAGGGLLLALMVGGLLLLRQSSQVPTVAIVEPTSPPALVSGQGIMVVAEGQAQAGVQRIELYINDVLQSQQAAPPGADSSFQATFPWFSSRTGIQNLSVIAYDEQGRASEPVSLSVSVEPLQMPRTVSVVVDQVEEQQEEAAEADSQMEEVATEEVDESPPEEESADGQDQAGGGEEVQPGEGEAAPPAEEQDGQPRDQDADQAEAEAEGDAPPEDDAEQAGGEEVEQDEQQEDQAQVEQQEEQPGDDPPHLVVTDLATRQEGGLHVSVQAVVEDDIGLDSLYIFRLIPDLSPETHKTLCGGGINCEERLNFSFSSGEQAVVVRAYDTAGQASETIVRTFQAMGEEGEDIAFVVADDFTPDQLEAVEEQADDPQELASGDDLGTPVIADYPCAGLEVVLEVPYKYVSDHGRHAYVSAYAVIDDISIAVGGGPVEQGTDGVVRFKMEKTSIDERVTTDQLTLQIREVPPDNIDSPFSGELFYEEKADITIHWQNPLPDLEVASVDRTVGGQIIVVEVRNNGCSPVEGFDALMYTPPGADNWRGSFERTIQPDATEEFRINGLDPNLYTREFEVVLDPDDQIGETDERNNSFLKPAFTLKYVHFYQAVINSSFDHGDISENEDDGEFYLGVTVGDQYMRSPGRGQWAWKENDSHDIGVAGNLNLRPIKLSPTLNWNDDLVIKLVMKEHDSFGGYQTVCSAERTHSHDIRQDGNWKSVVQNEFVFECDRFNLVYYRFVWDD